MTIETAPVRLLLGAGPARVVVASRGLVVAAAPGLLVVPRHRLTGGVATPVPGRFWLVHERSGRPLVSAAWCSHDVRRWAVAAGWIGVDWTVQPFTLHASRVVRTFVWRLYSEWRPTCPNCLATEHVTR